MKRLWVAFVIVATLGSIVPFNFRLTETSSFSFSEFLLTCCSLSSWGDILGNILLFLPIGFTGYLAKNETTPVIRRSAGVFASAILLALALQVLQIWLPSRDENPQDIIWNAVGTGAGILLAIAARRAIPASTDSGSAIRMVPLALVFCWVILRLIPFVPTIDLRIIKSSLRYVFYAPPDFVGVFHDFVAWSVFAYLLRAARVGVDFDRYLVGIVVAMFGLEVLIIYNSVTINNVLGAGLAVLAWYTLLRRQERIEWMLIALLASLFVIDGLAPFELRDRMAAMNWFPFTGFLRGSMFNNVLSAAEKVFLYGSFVYLLATVHRRYIVTTALAFVLIMVVEFAQTIFAGHTPEVTDGILVILAAAALYTLHDGADATAHPGVVARARTGTLGADN